MISDYRQDEILQQIRYINQDDPEYPERFQNYQRMPMGLYVLGRMPDPDKKTVAIVGARYCSPYGRAEASRFGEALAAKGVQIISGMAYGIDSWALHGALQAGKAPFAVLGSGVDVCYPKESYTIYRRMIREGGGILSEFEPGSEPAAWHFPIRNRIISAFADIVLVVEAKLRSGSLITADYALSQGKTIFAVPGRNMDALSQGCNRLISQGAGIAWSPEVILEELGMVIEPEKQSDELHKNRKGKLPGDGVPGQQTAIKNREENVSAPRSGNGTWKERTRNLPQKYAHAEDFQKVFGKLTYDPQNLDALQQRTGMDLTQLTRVLVQLTFSGFVLESPPGYYSRT
ncbi:MAG: DNA-processing protein DprA [Eubacterium sp.]|nr:DNA-processing protein DprA [Eubacterium sp.]